jgi:hypothetical protein
MRLSETGDLLIPRPWLALIPALVYAGLYLVSRRRFVLAVAVAWCVYAAMEFGNYIRWTCRGDCNIRIDLLLIYPVLILLSISGGVVALASIVAVSRSDH